MTLQEFIETRPQSYGTGNINLLYSSSVSGSNDIPIPPFHLQGLAVPFTSKEGTSIGAALKEVEKFRFEFVTGQVTAMITERQQKNSYYYFTFEEVVVNTLPSSVDAAGNTVYTGSQAVFVPYITTNFKNSPYNPTGNNSERSKLNSKVRKVDRQTSQFNPTNLTAILSGSAQFAEIQNCSYTKAGIINARYNGSKATSAGPIARVYNKEFFTTRINQERIPGNEPALNLITFQASIHADDANTTVIKGLLNADREIVDVLFNPLISGSHPNKTYPNFPVSSSFIYGLEGGKTFKLTNSKIYSIDTDNVFTTNNLGGVTLVE